MLTIVRGASNESNKRTRKNSRKFVKGTTHTVRQSARGRRRRRRGRRRKRGLMFRFVSFRFVRVVDEIEIL